MQKTMCHAHLVCPMCFDTLIYDQIMDKLKVKLLLIALIKWIIKVVVGLVILIAREGK